MRYFAWSILILALGFATIGCVTVDLNGDGKGYEVGDATRKALELQDKYCTTGDPVAKAALLVLVRSYVRGYPPSGLCDIDLVELILSKATGDLPVPDT